MRSLLVLIDGLGDEPIPGWKGLTPFQRAQHNNIDKLLDGKVAAEISICENDIIPESCSCILRLLGVKNNYIPKSRSYLELLAHNRDISEFEMVLRCNLVAVNENNIMTAFNGTGLNIIEMQEAAAVCNDILKEIEFIHLSEYRNLMILNREQQVLSCHVPPPHENVGENIYSLLTELMKNSLAMKYFLEVAEQRLQKFSRNGLRYMLYPWGAADRCVLPSFFELHHLKGAAVCKAEIVAGIATALGMQVEIPANATGDIDTDINAKTTAALNLLQENDFVIAHFNGSDEASHRYDAEGKQHFIEKIDEHFLGRIMRESHEPLKIVVCGDHVTSSVSGKHGRGAVPVVAGSINCSMQDININSYKDILNFLMRESD